MKVFFSQRGNLLTVGFEPEKVDKISDLKTFKGTTYKLNKRQCYFSMPDSWRIEDTHPDLLAAAAVMIIEPYSTLKIKFDLPISDRLRKTIKTHFKKELIGTGKTPNRIAPEHSVPSLAYSGGVDSTVATLIMPKDTELVFVERDSSKAEKPGLYKKEAALFACNKLMQMGHKVNIVRTDYEFVRDPVGFAWGISSAVPILLLADFLKLNSIAFGMVLESAYGIGDLDFRKPNNKWRDVLNAAGLPYNLVTAGLSEVATTKIIIEEPEYHKVAQSCIRGEKSKPCGRCLKCFRKGLLESALTGDKIDESEYEQKMLLPEIFNHITNHPIHHENVYAYALKSFHGRSKLIRSFKKKVRADRLEVTWMENWYHASKNLIFDKYTRTVEENILKKTKKMSSSDVSFLENWTPHTLKKSRKGYLYNRRHKKFIEQITQHVK